VNRSPLECNPPKHRATIDRPRPLHLLRDLLGRGPRSRHDAIPIGLLQHDQGAIRWAQAECSLDDRIEHRLQLVGRARNDGQHIAGGGLVCKRFAQLVEQSRVLDRDDSLIRERLDQCELLIGERSNLGPPHRNHANEDTFATHRHTEQCPDTARTRSFGVRSAPRRIGLCIKDLYCPVLKSYAPDDRTVSWPNTAMVCPHSKPRVGVVVRSEVVNLTVRAKDEPLLGRAKLRRVLDQSFENRLQVEG
jgi:hypothetical protein